MEYAIGAALALAVGLFATVSGFDRDRAFYPTVLIVVAHYYLLFALIGGSPAALGPEAAIFAVFAALAVVGFRSSLWFVVAGLTAHGLFDLLRGDMIANEGVPAWWPGFCLSFDLVAPAWLAWRLLSRRRA